MNNKRISDLPVTKIRESNIDFDSLLARLSAIDNESPIQNDITESILCLGNEIKKLREEIKQLKNNNS